MSHLSRKAPADIDDFLDQFSLDIEDYLSKSPITSKFREENPNLHPTSSDDFNMSEYRSLDPSIVTPPSPPISMSSDDGKEGFTKEHRQKPSMSSSINSSTAFATAPLEPEATTNELRRTPSRLDKFKRFSLTSLSTKNSAGHRRFGSSSSNNLLVNPRDSGSFSSRASTLFRNSSPHGGSPTLRNSYSNLSLSTMNTINDFNDEKISTPYWKYHILKFGKDLYLTTNPSLKHMYCRNGPGYYIEVKKENGNGFTMIFKDAEDQNKEPIMIITKKSTQDGGYFTASMNRSSCLKENIVTLQNSGKTYNGLAIPQTIPEEYIPYDKISNMKFFENNEVNFKNYEFRDFNSAKWNVGSIPRVRISKISKFKNKLSDSDDEHLKFMGKNNIYFHQNYIDTEQQLPYKLANPKDIYFQDGSKFPPVLAMFRPYKRNFTSKVKNFNKKIVKKSSPEELKPAKINNKFLHNDLAGGEVKNYYIAGDGLYYNKNPADDLPDDNKIGWLTIYEDASFQKRGMFDLVLGLTVAAGYESMVNI